MKTILTLSFLLLSLYSIAQKRQNVYYIKDGVPTINASDADYRRIIQEPDSGAKFYNLYEFYPNDVEKTIGYVSSFEKNLIYEGLLKKYNKKGILIEQSNYLNGKLNGEEALFYEDGKPKKVIIHANQATVPKSTGLISYKLIQFYDSLGNHTVTDGNGYYKDRFANIIEEGQVVNGIKDGIWKGLVGDDHFEEVYKNGEFISGLATLKNGKTNKYKVMEERPEYRGGIASFYSYLNSNIRYPKQAVNANFRGKIYVNFVIDKDGSLTDIKLRNSLGYGIDEEIIRVFQQCSAWFPGKQHGIPVRVKYNIAINYNP